MREATADSGISGMCDRRDEGKLAGILLSSGTSRAGSL